MSPDVDFYFPSSSQLLELAIILRKLPDNVFTVKSEMTAICIAFLAMLFIVLFDGPSEWHPGAYLLLSVCAITTIDRQDTV